MRNFLLDTPVPNLVLCRQFEIWRKATSGHGTISCGSRGRAGAIEIKRV